jgi:hypothetical protein
VIQILGGTLKNTRGWFAVHKAADDSRNKRDRPRPGQALPATLLTEFTRLGPLQQHLFQTCAT